VRRGFPAAIAVLALAFAPAATAGGPSMWIGATEEVVKQSDASEAKVRLDLVKLAGFDSIRVNEVWPFGARQPSEHDLTLLRNVVAGARLAGLRPVISVAQFGSRTTPLTDKDRDDFSTYAAALARALPTAKDWVIGNEPNLNRFWLPQFNPDGSDAAAPAYVALLAKTYDALKAVSPTIDVIGGAVSPRGNDRPDGIRLTHSPTTFIPDMGTAYRAMNRTAPIMDTFDFHPYTDFSAQPPTTQHPNSTTVAIADYDKLVGLLGKAFDGTPQKGSTLPILYGEFGIESQVPSTKSLLYTGTEPTTTRPVDEATQAAYYRQAIQLAFCQPNVMGFLVFHIIDETELLGWQSGVYYADGTQKSSLPGLRTAINEAHRGVVVKCPGMQLKVTGKITRQIRRGPQLGFTLTCDIDCNYKARVEKLPRHTTTLATFGRAIGGRATKIEFPQRRLAAGTYRYTVRLTAPVNTGTVVLLVTTPFTLTPS
jgi:hypothetical protein